MQYVLFFVLVLIIDLSNYDILQLKQKEDTYSISSSLQMM